MRQLVGPIFLPLQPGAPPAAAEAAAPQAAAPGAAADSHARNCGCERCRDARGVEESEEEAAAERGEEREALLESCRRVSAPSSQALWTAVLSALRARRAIT